MEKSHIVKQGLASIIILGIFVLAFIVLKPIIIPIIFGLLFGYIFSPVYKRIKKLLGGSNISAFILLGGIVVLIAIPLVFLIPVIGRQLFEIYVLLQNTNFNEILSRFFEGDLATSMAIQLDNIFGNIFPALMGQVSGFLQNLPALILQFAVFLFTFYFVVRDLDKLTDFISEMSPFSKSTEKKFLEEFRGITNAIIFGQVLIGIVQGLALGAGLFFLGVPKALLLTVITSIVSIIPVLGAWLVWMPVGIILLATGRVFSGIFIILYGALFVSLIDNFLRPYFLSRNSNLPIVLSVIGTIGGLFVFGIAGLVLGPLILAYVLIILEFYKQGKLNELFNRR
jgi:predicted PurR-regulated permease PerM